MAYSFAQGILDFTGGASKRMREYDEVDNKRNERLAEIKAKRQDELLKTRWTSEKKLYDEHSKINRKVRDMGGANTISAQMLLKDIETVDEYWKRREAAGDSWNHSTLFELGEKPTLTYSDENGIYKKLKGSTSTSMGQLMSALRISDKPDTTEPEFSESDLGSATTYRRGKSEELTEEQKTKMGGWKAYNKDNEQEWKFQWNTHLQYVKDATEKYKDSMQSDEAKQVFTQLKEDERTLIYGKDSQGSTTDWQRKLALHIKDTPKRVNFEDDTMFKNAMRKWTHGYNILKLGAKYDDSKGADKMQFIELVNPETNKKHKVGYTGNDNDIAFSNIGWKDFGVSSVTDKSINKMQFIELVNPETNKKHKVGYTGNDSDIAFGNIGWKDFGVSSLTPKTTDKIPTLQETYNSEGLQVKIQYTGNNKDSFEGRSGWVQVGSSKKLKGLSVAEEKWLPFKVIVDAIKEGRTVPQAQLDAAEFLRNTNEAAIPAEYSTLLNTWDNMIKNVKDYSYMLIELGGQDVPATTANIAAAAEEFGLSVSEYRKELIDSQQD